MSVKFQLPRSVPEERTFPSSFGAFGSDLAGGGGHVAQDRDLHPSGAAGRAAAGLE